MQQQFTQLVKFNNLADYQLTIQRMFQYEEVVLDYKDLDITFIDQILKVYEQQNDYGLNEYAKLERYLIKTSSQESDKEHFFERQHMILSKKLPYDFVNQLLGLLFQFKAKLNGQYSILFYFKSFEAFETVLRGIGNRSPLPSPKPSRVTLFTRQTSWKQPQQSIRNSNFSKIFKSAFTKKSKSDDVALLKNEMLYKTQKINGKVFYNLNEIDQFNNQEQQLLLNLSKQELQLISNDSDSSEHEEDQNEQNIKIGYDIDKREKYLNNIFGEVPKYTSVLMTTLPYSKLLNQDSCLVTQKQLSLNPMAQESIHYMGRQNYFIRTKESKWDQIKQNFIKIKKQKTIQKIDTKNLIKQYNPF